MSLEVTEIKITKIDGSKVKAFAKITFNGCFCVDGIRLIDGSKGMFIGMPSRKTKDDEYRDICFPINSETRKMLTDKILEAYDKSGDNNDPF